MGTNFMDLPVKFGKKICQIKSYNWNDQKKMADIVYVDEKGKMFATTAPDMDMRIIRSAVRDAIIADYNRP